ncbi:MAG: hypothetical protein WC795_02585 [Candidatus Paceibacterota bacterium]|jgi:hypothetical protein
MQKNLLILFLLTIIIVGGYFFVIHPDAIINKEINTSIISKENSEATTAILPEGKCSQVSSPYIKLITLNQGGYYGALKVGDEVKFSWESCNIPFDSPVHLGFIEYDELNNTEIINYVVGGPGATFQGGQTEIKNSDNSKLITISEHSNPKQGTSSAFLYIKVQLENGSIISDISEGYKAIDW